MLTKYNEKSSTWVGAAQFAFKGFVFTSTSLDWLAVKGTRLQISGSGRVNGKGSYGFMIDAVSGGPTAAYRIRIWDKTSGAIVYDNMPGAPDDALPSTPLKGGAKHECG